MSDIFFCACHGAFGMSALRASVKWLNIQFAECLFIPSVVFEQTSQWFFFAYYPHDVVFLEAARGRRQAEAFPSFFEAYYHAAVCFAYDAFPYCLAA